MIKKFLAFIAALIVSQQLFAQEVTMADEMRGNGKIYVVVAVMLTIFAGIVIYLIRLDRKLSRIEKNNS